MMVPIAFHTTDWNLIPHENENGALGNAILKVLQLPGIRLRMVEYSSNYLADHWCTKGHLLFCLEGAFSVEFKNGARQLLRAGMSFQVSNDMSVHRTSSIEGAKLLVIDGDFLTHEKKYTRGVIGLS